MYWRYIGDVLEMYWRYDGNELDIRWRYLHVALWPCAFLFLKDFFQRDVWIGFSEDVFLQFEFAVLDG